MFKVCNFLSKDEVSNILGIINALDWHVGENPDVDYREKVKKNLEIREGHNKISDAQLKFVQDKIISNDEVRMKTFPRLIVKPQFNKYFGGGKYGKHSDSHRLGKPSMRTDLSITVFLSGPDSYDGGVLTLEYASGEVKEIKEPAGTLVCYPSGVLHHVTPVTKGTRIAAIAWMQSWVRDPMQRDIVTSTLSLSKKIKAAKGVDSELYAEIVSIHTNLLRMWGDP